MKVLLTGSTGWIGSRVAKELVDRGHEVHCTIRKSSDCRRLADIVKKIQIHEREMDHVPMEPDCVVHLAWYAVPAKYLKAPENTECLEASLRLLSKVQCRVVFAGSCFEYDTQLGRLREDSPTRPLTLYSECKQVLSEKVMARPDSAWMRFFYQYGPSEHPHRQIPKTILGLLAGKPVPLSDGYQERDYLHVDDVAGAVVAVAESRLLGAVNVGSGRAVRIREIMTKLGDLAGRPEFLDFGAVPYYKNEPMKIEADNTKLLGTGWRPTWTLERGLQDTFAWWKGKAR